ncbi:MAG TPA: choice-of-anchor tandem repeat GloVer-containing protein [Cyclobacteriaceae bacterium]|nr:choice-of-anchor tandem repeat GloVer-containing protein [Cyclobacteriaceae bacterium]
MKPKKTLFLLVIVSLLWAQGSVAQTFYGVTRHGGDTGGGVIFKTNGDGSEISVEHSFDLQSNSGRSADYSVMLAAPNGLLYGTTMRGGQTDGGVLFSYNPTTNAYTQVFDFNHLVATGNNPIGRLVLYNNLLYGVTNAGGNTYQGTIFSVNPATGEHTKLYDFDTASGINPFGGLTLVGNMLYGMTGAGGATDDGTLYRFDPNAGTLTVMHNFAMVATGRFPIRELTLGTNGKLYGMTVSGGANGYTNGQKGFGTLFEYDVTNNVLTKKFDFNGSAGTFPIGSLLQSTTTGKFYGGCASGGANDVGVIFEYDPTTSVMTKKVDMDMTNGNGQFNIFARASNDKMYATTEIGGTLNSGALFEYVPGATSITNKLNFDGYTNGYSPKSGLTLAANGNFYGMTAAGGFKDNGTLFEWNPTTNAFVQKISFKVSSTGITPENSLLQASNGKMIGVTVDGGVNGTGVIYEFDPLTKQYTMLRDFDNYLTTGSNPFGGLTLANDGKYYGVTEAGGTSGAGILYQYDYATKTFTKKQDFNGATIGGGSVTQMVVKGDILYGVTRWGGAQGLGTIFEYNYVQNTLEKKHDFTGLDAGGNPMGHMVLASDGMLYGMTVRVYLNNVVYGGVIYQYNPNSHGYTVKVVFDDPRGVGPESGLVEVDGKLYGVTVNGGANGRGTLFEYDLLTGNYNKLVDMDYHTAESKSTLVRGAGKKLYGWTEYNGDFGVGVIYEYDIETKELTPKSQFDGENGAHPGWGRLLVAKLPPVVTALSPETGPVGSSVNIQGANFSGNDADNIVYFGAVRATITGSSSTELTVTVPPGANYAPVTVTVNGLTGASSKPFVTTFAGGQPLTTIPFGDKNDYTTGEYPIGATVADLDGDGRPELIVANHSGNTISVFQNLAAPGVLAAGSLASKIDIAANASPIGVAAGDIDGDGLLDIVATNTNNTVSVFRNKHSGNTFSAGALFDTRVDFTVDNNSYDVAIGDLDGDGRNDIVTANMAGPTISVLRNTATPGSITVSSFAPKIDFAATSGINSLKLWDLDGDKKPDVVYGIANGNIGVFRNQSTPGSFLAGSLAAKVEFTTPAVNGFAIGDIDGDNLPDLAVGTSINVVSVLRSSSVPGIVSFAPPVTVSIPQDGTNCALSDVDGDGKLDIVASGRLGNAMYVFKNTGNAAINTNTFASPVSFSAGTGPGAILPADMDNDGKPDFILVNNTVTTTNKITLVHNKLLATEPTAQPSALTFGSVTSTSMSVTITPPTPAPDGYLVVMSYGVAPTFVPTDGIAYPRETFVGKVGDIDMVIAHSGPNAIFTLDELAAGTNVFFKVFAYKGSNSVINYLLTAPLTGSRSTLAEQPTTQATNIVVTPTGPSSVSVTFTNGNGTGRLLVVRSGSAVDGTPVDGTSYTATGDIAAAAQLGTGNFIVGNQNPATVTGLSGGATYHFRVFEFNGTAGTENYFNDAATGNPASITTDNTPPAVTIVPVGATPGGVQLNVSATVTDSQSPITEVMLYYRSISAGGTPTSKKMDKGSGDNYSAAIPAEAIGELGVEYKIRATSGGGTSPDPKYTAVVVTSTSGANTTIAYDAFGKDQNNYRIISVPLSLSAKTVQAVFDEFTGIDKKVWRLSRYSNSSLADLALTDNIEPGKGYWLLIKDAKSISTGGGTTVTTTSDEPFSIDLTSGWNQIGNPYPFNILWSDMVAANDGLTTLRTFRADNNPSSPDYPWGDGTILRAKEGGFFNNTGNLQKLKFPVVKKNTSRVQENPFITNPLTDPNWQLYIVAKHNNLVNGVSGIGMRENALENSDPFDGYSMPRFFDRYLEINHKKKFGNDHMSMDIVPPADDYTWEFDIESSEADRFVTLEWNNTNFGDNDLGMILWDEARQYGVDMRMENSYTFDRSISKAFKVYFGKADKLVRKLEIRGLFLHSVSPNPAEADVKLAFSVPAAQTVEFEAIDMLGKAIWKASGNFNKGYHEVLWNGETRTGARGIYIIRLRSGDETKTSRIYLK